MPSQSPGIGDGRHPNIDQRAVVNPAVLLFAATPDRFTEIAHVPALEGKTWNHPVIVRDELLVRNDHEMAAYKLSRENR